MTKRRTRILVIDSEPRIERQLSRLLDDAHFDVQRVVSGHDGVVSARQQTPDCIVLSADLPDGFVHARKLKIDDKLAQIPLILTTGSLDNDTLTKHRKLPSHADAYVTLPVPDPDLLHTVAKLLPGFATIDSDDSEIDDLVDLEIVDETEQDGTPSVDVYPTLNQSSNEYSFGDSFLPEPTLPGADLPPYDPDTTRGNAGLSRPASRKRHFGSIQPVVNVPLPVTLESPDVRAVRDELKLSQLLLRQREEQILALETQLDEARRAANDIELTRRSKQPAPAAVLPPPVPGSVQEHRGPGKSAQESQRLADRDAEWSRQLQQKQDALDEALKEIKSLNNLIGQLNNNESQAAANRAVVEQALSDAVANNKLLADQVLDNHEKLEHSQQQITRLERENNRLTEQLSQKLVENADQSDKLANRIRELEHSAEQLEQLATTYMEELETQKEASRKYERQLQDAHNSGMAAEQTIASLRSELVALKADAAEADAKLQQAAVQNESVVHLTEQLAALTDKLQVQEEQIRAHTTERDRLLSTLNHLTAEYETSLGHIRNQLETTTQERDRVQAQATASAGDLTAAAELFREQEKQIEMLVKRAVDAEESLKILQESDQEQKSAMIALQEQLGNAAKELEAALVQVQEQRFLADAAEERLRESSAQYSALIDLNTALDQRAQTAESAATQLQREVDSLRAETESSQVNAIANSEKIEQLTLEVEQWHVKFEEMTSYTASLEKDLAKSVAERTSLAQHLEARSTQLQSAETAIKDLQIKIIELEQATKNLEDQLAAHVIAQESTEADLKHAREAGLEALEALEEAHAERGALTETIASLKKENDEIDEKLRNMAASFALEQSRRRALSDSLNDVKEDLANALSKLMSITESPS